MGRFTASGIDNDWTAVVRSDLAQTASNQRDMGINAVDMDVDGNVAWAGFFKPCLTGAASPFTQELTATSDDFTTPTQVITTFRTTAQTYMPMYGMHDDVGDLVWFKTVGASSDAPTQDEELFVAQGVVVDEGQRVMVSGRMQDGSSVQVLDEGDASEVTFSNTSTSSGTKGWTARLDPADGSVLWAQRVQLDGSTSAALAMATTPHAVGRLAWGVSGGAQADIDFDPQAELGSTVTVAPPTGTGTGKTAALAVMSASSGAMSHARVMPDSQTGTNAGLTILVLRSSTA